MTFDLHAHLQQLPLLKTLAAGQACQWFNPAVCASAEALGDVGLTAADIDEAAARLQRFAPWLAREFPETTARAGLIESPVLAADDLHAVLAERYQVAPRGRLWFKLDSHLPISGSIKARGGIYEVLKHAEQLALAAGLLQPEDDYGCLAEPRFAQFFGQYKVAVGSTGNLGLSIGLISARLGFQASVHMSSDARAWKKALLREQGVEVVEYDSDYSVAVAEGRRAAEADPRCHFVDDENSTDLFLGYAVAGERLKQQLQEQGVRVDAQHPLFVYLPCGVGGGPGGVAFGLKQAFGDAVHCVFAEPTHSPCMLLGVYSGLHEQISVQDIGLDNRTAADGLAVGRPSGFVGRAMQRLIDGYFTVEDDELYRLLSLAQAYAGVRLEPSAVAGLPGFARILQDDYLSRMGFDEVQLGRATHLVWATGGSLVPEPQWLDWQALGQRLLSR